MANPFKVGDKVTAVRWGGDKATVMTISEVRPEHCLIRDDPDMPGRDAFWHYTNLRAYIEPVRDAKYEGHLADGSGLQAHSVTPLYPYVISYRDKKNRHRHSGKYDVGIDGPHLQETAWVDNIDRAIAIINALKAIT